MINGQIILCQQQPYYLFYNQNMSVINPAATSIEGSVIRFNHKSSMIGVEGGPSLQSIIFHSNIDRNAAWGISIQNEKVNIESHGAATADYSYRLKFSNDSYLNLGIKGGMFFNNIDINAINRITPEGNPDLSLVKNYSNPILGLGVFFKAKNYFLALSMNNLLKSNRYEEESGLVPQSIDSGQIYSSFGFNINLNGYISIEPSMIYSIAKDIENQMVIVSSVNIGENISFALGAANNKTKNFQILFKNLKSVDFGIGYEMRAKNSILNGNNLEIYLGYKLISNGGRKPSWERRK